MAGGYTVLHQRDKVLPLEARGVLEFIDEVVAVAIADALIDEGRGFVLHHFGDASVELGDVYDFVVAGVLPHQLAKFVEQGQRVEVFEQELPGVVEGFLGSA